MSDYEYLEENADPLLAHKKDTVTIEYINKKPEYIEFYRGKYAEETVKVKDLSFKLPNKSGTYNYEIVAKYSNGVVSHFLKVRVK